MDSFASAGTISSLQHSYCRPDELVNFLRRVPSALLRASCRRARLALAVFHLLQKTGDANFDEFVQVARRDREKLHALEHGIARVVRFFQHSLVELQPGEMAVENSLWVWKPLLAMLTPEARERTSRSITGMLRNVRLRPAPHGANVLIVQAATAHRLEAALRCHRAKSKATRRVLLMLSSGFPASTRKSARLPTSSVPRSEAPSTLRFPLWRRTIACIGVRSGANHQFELVMFRPAGDANWARARIGAKSDANAGVFERL